MPAAASAQEALEGQWRNPKGSVVVRMSPCGNAYCGTVARASEKAKANARGRAARRNWSAPGSLRAFGRPGDGMFKGQAFEPKRNIRAPATIRQVGPNAIGRQRLRGRRDVLCKEQRWTRVS